MYCFAISDMRVQISSSISRIPYLCYACFIEDNGSSVIVYLHVLRSHYTSPPSLSPDDFTDWLAGGGLFTSSNDNDNDQVISIHVDPGFMQ